MTDNIARLELQFGAELKNISSVHDLDSLKSKYLGKSGLIKDLFSVNIDEDKTSYLKGVNDLSRYVSSVIVEKKQEFKVLELEKRLQQEAVDITYPIRPENYGKIHPISKTIRDAGMIFNSMGFQNVSGPEIEDEYHVFDALNTPSHHPARQMQDSFYLSDDKMLRTHTSSVQIRKMERQKPPFYMISIGRVYRKDWDATHTPMFHQIEGLCIDTDINMCNMKYCLDTFLQKFFGDNVETRMRPSYFPFTEPSAEVDIKRDKNNWLEILGCGMVHPNVLKNVNIDSTRYQGFAFGIGIERLTMIKYNIQDLRDCFTNDLRWLEIFGVNS